MSYSHSSDSVSHCDKNKLVDLLDWRSVVTHYHFIGDSYRNIEAARKPMTAWNRACMYVRMYIGGKGDDAFASRGIETLFVQFVPGEKKTWS